MKEVRLADLEPAALVVYQQFMQKLIEGGSWKERPYYELLEVKIQEMDKDISMHFHKRPGENATFWEKIFGKRSYAVDAYMSFPECTASDELYSDEVKALNVPVGISLVHALLGFNVCFNVNFKF